MNKQLLLINMAKLHTTSMGIAKIKKVNLNR